MRPIPLPSDVLRWVADQAGFPFFEETSGRGIIANAAALEILGSAPAHIEAGLAALVGLSVRDPATSGLLAQARRGSRTTGILGAGEGRPGWRVLFEPLPGGRVRVMAIPGASEATAAVQRRAAAAELGAAVAHEVANALSAISGWAQLARDQDPEETREAFTLIERSANDARQTSRRLLEAVRGQGTGNGEHESTGPVDLAGVLDEVFRLIRPLASRRGVHVEIPRAQGMWVQAGRAPLFTVFWNLVLNAVEALGRGGNVQVSCSAERGIVRAIVADDGPGMEQAQRVRAFEPYFTTKSEGTGLGLALVKGAVEEAGGRISLESTRGRGTRFLVELPRAAQPNSVPRRRREVPGQHRSGVIDRFHLNGAHVLVVEDDDAVREFVAATLEMRGVNVQVAASARDARLARGPFDAVLIDLSLTDARGDDVLAELRARNAVRASALMSGVARPPDLHPNGEPDAWLRKPFDLPELLSVLDELLAVAGDVSAQVSG